MNIIVSKTSDHIQIKIKMPNPSQDTPAFSKAQNQDFKGMDILGAFKIKIEGKNLELKSRSLVYDIPMFWFFAV